MLIIIIYYLKLEIRHVTDFQKEKINSVTLLNVHRNIVPHGNGRWKKEESTFYRDRERESSSEKLLI